MFLTFRKKRWQLVRRYLKKGKDEVQGYCESPTKKGKQIVVCTSVKGEKELETLIHEFLHASLWMADEEWIQDAGEAEYRARVFAMAFLGTWGTLLAVAIFYKLLEG